MNYNDIIILNNENHNATLIDKDLLLKDVPDMSETMAIRTSGKFENKAYWLDDSTYDWVIGLDNEANLILIPLKKK